MSYTTATLGMLALRNQVKLPARRIGNLDMNEEEVHSYSDNLQYGFLLPSTLNTMAECMVKTGQAIEEDDRDQYKRNSGLLKDLVRIVPDKHNIYLSTMNVQEGDLQLIDSRKDIYNAEWADMITAKRDFAYWAADRISFDDEGAGLWRAWDAVQEFPTVQGIDVESASVSSTGNQNVTGNKITGTAVGHRTPGGPSTAQNSGINVPSAAANTIQPNQIHGTATTTSTPSSSTDGSLSRLKRAVKKLKDASSR